MKDPGNEKEGGKVVLLMLLALILLLGGGYAAAYVVAGDKVPRGTTVAGVDVGGRTQAEAVLALEAGLSERSNAPIPVTVDGVTEEVVPKQAGLAVDYVASIEDAGGEESWEPGRLWDYFTGGDELEAVVTVDDEAMTRTIDGLIEAAGTLPRNGDVDFRGNRVRVTDPVAGEAIDPDEARAALEAAYLQDGATAELTLAPAAPAIDQADVQRALDEFANPALSGPVTLVFDRSRVRLLPREFAPVLGMRAQGGELVPQLDEEALIALVDGAISKDGAPVDATVRLVDGKPQVIPAKPGVSYEPDDVSDAFLDLVVQPAGERQQKVKATVAKADFTTKEARALEITERVSTFTTYYPYAEYRNINIGRAAELVNGTILKPGEDVLAQRRGR